MDYLELRPIGDDDRNWRSCSISGAYIIVGIYNGRLYVSSDYGVSWTEKQPAGATNKIWRSCFANGAYMLAGAYNGRLYISSNYGVTWAETQPAGNVNKAWYCCSISGAYMIAGVTNGRLYTSSNYGVSWTERQPAGGINRNWRSCAVDGAYMIAATHYLPPTSGTGRVYTSSNYGVNWTQRYPAGVTDKYWLCCSVKGAHMLVGVNNGRLYKSSNYGVNWVEVRPAGDANQNWYDCSVSTYYMIVVTTIGVGVGRIFTSVDNGVTWVEQQPEGDNDKAWQSCSADGFYMVAGIYGGRIWRLFEAIAVTVYDYPLMPVVFPAKVRTTTLMKDCINFEESMSDICLVLNNNTKVIREYSQLTYGDDTYPESSNLRDILSSQQLVKLSKDEVNLKAIINNFINNISDMFMLINGNNNIVKQWLDDYEPDEEAHEFTDVIMKPIVVDEDLNKAIDDLFEGMGDNVLILNNNIEVMKERF